MLNNAPYACPDELMELARHGPRIRTAIAGAESKTALKSAKMAWEGGLIEPLMVGVPEEVARAADDIGWDIGRFALYPAEDGTAAQAAIGLARAGEAQVIMKGQVRSDALMRAVFDRDKGLRIGHLISHVFHMTIPRRSGFLLITDAAVNVAPDVAARVQILRNAVELLHAMGIRQPKAAVLSASEARYAGMPSTEEAAEIVTLAREGAIDDALVDGPLALDGAISAEAARIKALAGPVAGEADILLVPNIETGNVLFKSMVHFAGATAAGVVLGAKVPIVLTSRADPPEARLAACALASVAAAKGG
jgi:phosphotransacetylase